MQPDPKQPLTTYTKLLSKLPKPTPLRMFGVLGFSLVALGYQLRNLCSRIGVEEYSTGVTGPFENSGLTETTVTVSGPSQVQKDLTALEKLVNDDEAIYNLAERVIASAEDVTRRGGRGRLFYRRAVNSHAYGFHSYLFEVPEKLRQLFMAPDNNNVFTSLITCFNPFAWLMPRDLPGYDLVFHGDEYALSSETRDKVIALHNQNHWANNLPPQGHVSLGANGNITFSHYRRIADERRGLIVWLAIASTLPSHPLDGRAVWALAYDTRRHRIVSFHLGAGEDNLPAVDYLNPFVAGFVFGTMFHTFTGLLRTATTAELPWLLGPDRAARLDQLHRLHPELTAWRITCNQLDMYAGIGGFFREWVAGGNVTGAPESTEVRSTPRIEEILDDEQ